MSYHIVSIDTPQCFLGLRDKQLICNTDEGKRQLPLEDVASIIVTSFSATIHSHLLLGAAKQGVALIICESYKPVALLLPANRSTDTLLTRAVLNLSEKVRSTLWQKTVDAKCQNQVALARSIASEDARIHVLESLATSKKKHKEAFCARYYWQVLGKAIGDDTFTRDRHRKGLNSLLNYGYAVLLARVLQNLYAVGLDPTFGLSHATRERSVPLAYDLMEPFRPCVDLKVYQWARTNPPPWEVSKTYKKHVISFLQEKIRWRRSLLEVENVIEGAIRSFRKAVLEGKPQLYQPWILKN